jgi:hypothetical protein
MTRHSFELAVEFIECLVHVTATSSSTALYITAAHTKSSQSAAFTGRCLAVASTCNCWLSCVSFGGIAVGLSGSYRTHDHIILSHDCCLPTQSYFNPCAIHNCIFLSYDSDLHRLGQSGKLLLALASTVILGSEFWRTPNCHMLEWL